MTIFIPRGSVPVGRIWFKLIQCELIVWNVPWTGAGTLSWQVSCHAVGKLRLRGWETVYSEESITILTQKAARKSPGSLETHLAV